MKHFSRYSKLFSILVIAGLVAAFLPRQSAQAASTTIMFTPVADATVKQSNPTTNYGTSTALSVDGSPIIRSYMKFNVSGLNGAKVLGASLHLYVTDDSASGFSVAKASSSSWDEKTIVYNNAPGLGSKYGSIGAYGANKWIEINVTGAVTGEGVVTLVMTTTYDTTTAVLSREGGSNRPQLILSLGTPTSSPSVTPTNTYLPIITKTATLTSVPSSTSTPVPAPTNTTVPTIAPTQSSLPMPYGQTGAWTLKWSDEFNGTALDLNKWEPNWLAGNNTAITKPIDSHEESCYDPKQVSVANGSMKLSAVARSCLASNGVTYNYASGMVNSHSHYTFNYGYMEARVWLDGASTIKNWPAFWADGTGTWPTTGEIDVMEGLGGKPSWHYHWGTSSSPQSVGGYPTLSSSTGWHIFAADWEPGVIKYYYDGVLVGQVTSNVVNSYMYLIFDYGVSSSISGPILVPSDMLVDYVRVWQK